MDQLFVKITKLEELPEAQHPLNISVGRILYGLFEEEPQQNFHFRLSAVSNMPGQRGITTSRITEIIDDNHFKTLNSLYKWEFISKDQIPN
jgi:hypothetical protein